MRKGLDFWRRLSGIDKTFFVSTDPLRALWPLREWRLWDGRWWDWRWCCRAVGASSGWCGGRSKGAIWRLRNRLIVAYLFIAVVPVVLILVLMLVTSYAVIGQMAVYLVNRELENRMRTLRHFQRKP